MCGPDAGTLAKTAQRCSRLRTTLLLNQCPVFYTAGKMRLSVADYVIYWLLYRRALPPPDIGVGDVDVPPPVKIGKNIFRTIIM